MFWGRQNTEVFKRSFFLSVLLNVTLYATEDVCATLKYLTKMFINNKFEDIKQ